MKQYIVNVYNDRIEWFNQAGQRHREGGLPAIECADGGKEYFVKGQRHRDGGLPAVEWSDGHKSYWINDRLHRDGGLPAIEYSNGTKAYYVNGKLHRESGLPACEYSNGDKSYYVNGQEITKRQAEKLAKPTYEGKFVEIDGRKYELKEIK
jgi:hypothetical protein